MKKETRSEIGRKAVKKGKWWEWYFAKELGRLLNTKFMRTRASEKALLIHTGDIVCVDRSTLYYQDLSWQVKARERGNPFQWWKKAKDDAHGKKPIVIWQKANKEPLAIMSLKDLTSLLYELEGWRKEKGRQ